MLSALLLAVQQDQASANERQQPALPTNEVDALRNRVASMFGYALPEAYLHILAQADGLDCNGIVLYASRSYYEGGKFIIQSLAEANLALRDYPLNRDYLYFAESGMDLYRHNLSTDQYEICTRVGLRVMESFTTADELFERMLAQMLE